VKEYDNTNTGLLAKNDRKQKETQPDYTGSINVGGVEYWLNGWLRTGKNGRLAGQQFFSLSVKPKDGLPAARPAPKANEVSEDNWDKIDFEDDKVIPF
jgi:hypothetical protein